MEYDSQIQELMLSNPQARRVIMELEKEDHELFNTLRLLEPYRSPRYNATDAGNGYLFADLYGSHARFLADRGVWLTYANGVWKRDHANAQVMELCRRLARMMHVLSFTLESVSEVSNAQKRVERMYSLAGRERMLRDAQTVYPLMSADLDEDPWLLNCQNGVIDLRSGAFREHRPSDLMTRICGAAYDPHARCARWEDFIRQIMESPVDPDGAPEREAYLRRALGCALSGDTREECLFILYGASTRNGKGTLMETMQRMLGDYARAAQPESIGLKSHAQSASAASEDIARLAGARLVSISEPDQKLTLSASLIKQLTGGDTITARFLHETALSTGRSSSCSSAPTTCPASKTPRSFLRGAYASSVSTGTLPPPSRTRPSKPSSPAPKTCPPCSTGAWKGCRAICKTVSANPTACAEPSKATAANATFSASLPPNASFPSPARAPAPAMCTPAIRSGARQTAIRPKADAFSESSWKATATP